MGWDGSSASREQTWRGRNDRLGQGPWEICGLGRQGSCRTWVSSSSPASLALAHICSLGLTGGTKQEDQP